MEEKTNEEINETKTTTKLIPIIMVIIAIIGIFCSLKLEIPLNFIASGACTGIILATIMIMIVRAKKEKEQNKRK